MDGGTERLFVALPVPDTIAAALAAMQPPAVDGVRPTHRAGMHVTLHFLGQADTARIDAALRRVKAAAFIARPAPAGHFALRGGKTILWVGIEPTAPLITLHAETGSALRTAGFEPERRPYVPHITLARLGSRAPRGLVTTFEQQDLPNRLRAFECDRFALFASETAPEGARYRVLETYPLTAGA